MRKNKFFETEGYRSVDHAGVGGVGRGNFPLKHWPHSKIAIYTLRWSAKQGVLGAQPFRTQIPTTPLLDRDVTIIFSQILLLNYINQIILTTTGPQQTLSPVVRHLITSGLRKQRR